MPILMRRESKPGANCRCTAVEQNNDVKMAMITIIQRRAEKTTTAPRTVPLAFSLNSRGKETAEHDAAVSPVPS